MGIRLKLSEINPQRQDHTQGPCPVCGNTTWRSHGWEVRAVLDTAVTEIQVQRLQCTSCNATVRVYPTGVSHRLQTEQLRKLSILLWLLGASYRNVHGVLVALDCPLSHTAIYQNVVEADEAIQNLKIRRQARRVQLLTVDAIPKAMRHGDAVWVEVVTGSHHLFLEVDRLPTETQESLWEWIHQVGAAVGAEPTTPMAPNLISDLVAAWNTDSPLRREWTVADLQDELERISQQLHGALDAGAAQEEIAAAMERLLELRKVLQHYERSGGQQLS